MADTDITGEDMDASYDAPLASPSVSSATVAASGPASVTSSLIDESSNSSSMSYPTGKVPPLTIRKGPSKPVVRAPGFVVQNDDDDDEDDDDDDDEDKEDDDDDDDDEEDDDDDDDDEEDEDYEEDEETLQYNDSAMADITHDESMMDDDDDEIIRPRKVGRPASLATSTPGKPAKRRGRPTRAEMEIRQRELEERIARGEVDEEPKPKRRGRKPRAPEEKARIREERKKSKQKEREEKRRNKLMKKQRIKEEKERKRREKEERKQQRLAKRMRPETEEEKEAKMQARRAKYEEIKKQKQEKEEKRRQRNEDLRLMRKQRKEEEQKQREAYEKRMQELKANFLDETSHLSGADVEASNLDETSQSSFTGTTRRYGVCGAFEMSNLKPVRAVTAETLMEYRWPLEDRHAEHYFLQEQVCEYLGVKSFKRRYPDVQRRNVDHEERDFLVEIGVVNEVQADLGLTAIPSSQVLDIMSNDFYDKYDEYMAVVMERKDRNLRQCSQNYNTSVSVPVEKHKLQDFVEKAIRSAAEWNKAMNADRHEKRRSYFDLQTFIIHKPIKENKTKESTKPKVGHYPVALIPGQYTDYYKAYTPKELAYLPLNSCIKCPPVLKPGMVGFASLDLKDDVDHAERCSMCSSVEQSDSEQDRGDCNVVGHPEEVIDEIQETKPKKIIDREVFGAKCKNCNGDRQHNKLGVPEIMLHCSNCEASYHPTCLGLCLELLQYVTNYNWECTECKVCSKCTDHSDEDKMLFCDLCDRGYHSYCVGLDEIPSGRWHCVECSYCISCKTQDPSGNVTEVEGRKSSWVHEYKIGTNGNKIYSHTLCAPCHKYWKKSQVCPECSVCFSRERYRMMFEKNKSEAAKWKSPVQYASCWVCGRQHHANCVANPDHFICAACQKRTLEKSVGSGNFAVLNVGSLIGTGPGDRTSMTMMNSSMMSLTSTPYSTRIKKPRILDF